MKIEDKEQLLNDLWKQYHKVCKDCGPGNGCDDCRDCPSAAKKDEIRKKIEKLKTNYETKRQSDMENTIEIPEGYEARIKGNKVIFEPKENENERIKKDCIKYLDWEYQHCPSNEDKMKIEKCIVWLEKQGEQDADISSFPKEQQAFMRKYVSLDKITLIKLLAERDATNAEIIESFEKQGEQKPHNICDTCEDIYSCVNPCPDKLVGQKSAKKVEPKFKIGDWVINTKTKKVEQIIDITDSEYFCSGTMIISFNDQHLLKIWTIEDAKDGDILVMTKDGDPFIFKGFLDKFHPNCPVAYGGVTHDGIFDISSGDGWWDEGEISPATNVQYDLLFQKMKEAGYEWDAEKKELKKIEQKLSTSVTEFDTEVERFCKECFITDTNEKGNVFCIARHFADWQKKKDESDDNLYAIHFEKWNITGECPSELEAKIDAKFGITGRDSNGKPSNGYCDWKKDVFTNGPSIYSFVKLGMDYQKEQMMKDAVEATIVETQVGRTGSDLDLLISIPENLGLKDGDEVKVIINKQKVI